MLHGLNVLMNRLLMSNSSALTRTIRRSIWAVVILLVYYFTLIGGFAPGIREYRWRMITVSILVLLWGGWFLWKLLHGEDVPGTRLDVPLLAMLGASLLATVVSTDLRTSLDTLLTNIVLAISFYFTIDWMSNQWRANLLINAILLTGGVVCLVGFFELWQWYNGDWISPVSWHEAGFTWSLDNSLRIKSVLHNPNALAYYLILLIGLAFYKLFQGATIWQRGLWGCYLVMAAIAAVLTQSRGGLLGVSALLMVVFVLFLWSRLKNKLVKSRFVPGRWAAMGILLFLILLISTWMVASQSMVNSFWNAGFLSGRNYVWEGAVRIFLSHPILGTGPGTFAVQYMTYRDHAWHNTIYTHAHNVWLTLASEYGVIGVLAVACFFIVLARMALRYLWQVKPGEWSWAMGIGLGVLAGQGVHNLVDDFMEFPVFTWFTILALVLCLQPMPVKQPTSSPKRKKWRLLLVGGGMLVALGGALWYGRAFAAYDRARLAAQADNWVQSVQWLEKAVALDPGYHFYRQQLALAYGELARTDDHYLPSALAQQKQVYDQSGSYPTDVAYLACLSWESDQPERAVELMHKAVSITPRYEGSFYSYHLSWPSLNFNLGHYLESVGQGSSAEQAYAQALLAFPQLATSPYWQISDSRRHMLQASIAVAQEMSQDKDLGAQIAFYGGDYQTALELFTSPPLNQIGQAKSLLALGQTEKSNKLLAMDSLQSRAESFPSRAALLMTMGDLSQAEASIKRAIVLSHQTPTMLLEEPSYYYLWGQLAELRGDLSLAEQNYERAIATSTTIETVYANLVGRREPLPTEKPFCLMVPYPEEHLSKPSLALADLMVAQGDVSEAVAVYRNLLRHEPYNLVAQQRLAELLSDASAGVPVVRLVSDKP